MLHLAVFLIFFFLTAFSASDASDGVNILFSSSVTSRTGQVDSLQIVDMSKPQLLPNGQYSSVVVARAEDIFRKNLELNSAINYGMSPYNNSLYEVAIRAIMRVMEVDLKIIMPAVINKLLEKYVLAALKHNSSTFTSSDDPLNPQQAALRKDMRHIIIFAQECLGRDIKIPSGDALTLLKSVYRFGAVNLRYGLAFQQLYVSLSLNGYSAFYRYLSKHFLPSRAALPILFVHIESADFELKPDYINLMKSLYTHVMAIDRESDRDAFIRHSCMVFSSLIACNLLVEFDEMISTLLPLLDMVKLAISPRIVKSVTRILGETKDHPTPMIEGICRRFFSNNAFLSMKKEHFLSLGEIFSSIQEHQSDLYEQLMPTVSNESIAKLFELDEYFQNYNRMLQCIEAFDILFDSFEQLDRDELAVFSEKLSDEMKLFPEIVKDGHEFSIDFVSKIFIYFPDMLGDSFKDDSREKDGFRYILFVKLLQMLINSPIERASLVDLFSKTLLFFNLRLKDSAEANHILAVTNMNILDLVEILMEESNFFISLKHLSVLYTYLKLVSEENADLLLNACFRNYLVNTKYKSLAVVALLTNVNRLQIDCNAMFANFLIYFIYEFLEVSKTTPIELFSNGDLIAIVRIFRIENVLNKSELEFAKRIIRGYAVDKNIKL